MKLKINFKKVITAFILIVVICATYTGVANPVYGKINKYYSAGEVVGSIDLDKASSNSTILGAIGYFIYAIAGFVEEIIGTLIGNFTGSEIFPWADKVVFNTIPFLDVNFLSPSNGSMFRGIDGENTIFGEIVSKIYYTLFTLAITFFGVVVGIMALKLAISSIAAEKAKYKQAITNWLLALILIFTCHYLISFIFFINEKMVEVASSILKTQVEENIDQIKLDFTVNQSEESLTSTMDALVLAYYEIQGKGDDLYCLYDMNNQYSDIKLLTVDANVSDGKYGYRFFQKYKPSKESGYNGTYRNDIDYEYLSNRFYLDVDGWDDNNWKEADKILQPLDSGLKEITDNRFKMYLSYLMSNPTYLKKYRSSISVLVDSTTGVFQAFDFRDVGARNDIRRLINDALFLTNIDPNVMTADDGKVREINDDHYNKFYTVMTSYCRHMSGYETVAYMSSVNYEESLADVLLSVYKSVNSGATGGNDEAAKEILSGISNFFKNSIYSVSLNYRNGDYDNDKEELVDIEFQPIIAILYAIFVIQSVMYFIAYMKRFFYIVILAMFAPLVIIYDFLMKSVM